MLLGPIFQVELVSTSRRGRYFALRVLYGLLILLVLWSCYETSQVFRNMGGSQMSIRAASQLAAGFFLGFSWLQMMAIMLVGPAMAVGTIATERERRTIEYLFATDLSNLEIIGGKTVARLLLVAKLVLVGLPILFLFRLMGGIPANALLTVYLLSASTALLVTSLGICISVWSKRSRDGVNRVYLLMFALFMLPSILQGVGMGPVGRWSIWQYLIGPAIRAVMEINPFNALFDSLGNQAALGFGIDMAEVLQTVFWQVAVSLAVLTLATLAVRRVHLGESSRGSTKSKQPKQLKALQWRPALGEHPMVWKEMFAGTAKTQLGIVGTVALLLILVTILGFAIFWFIGSVKNGREEDYLWFVTIMNGMLGSAMLLMLAARASGLVTNEIEKDCWTSILATPLSGLEIMTGKMWGNLYNMRGALIVLGLTWAFGLLLDPWFIMSICFTLITFVLMAWYVTNLGLLFSLKSKTSLRAMGGTLGTLIFTSGGYLFCCCTIMMSGGGGGEEGFLMMTPCIPFLLAFPTMAYIDIIRSFGPSNVEAFAGTAYVFGMFLYFIVAIILFYAMTNRFDEFSGRTTGRTGLG